MLLLMELMFDNTSLRNLLISIIILHFQLYLLRFLIYFAVVSKENFCLENFLAKAISYLNANKNIVDDLYVAEILSRIIFRAIRAVCLKIHCVGVHFLSVFVSVCVRVRKLVNRTMCVLALC